MAPFVRDLVFLKYLPRIPLISMEDFLAKFDFAHSPALEFVSRGGLGFGQARIVRLFGFGLIASLLVAVTLLDLASGSLSVAINLVVDELDPQFVELSCVLLNVVWVVDHQQVLLVFAASLEGPVEGSCEEEF